MVGVPAEALRVNKQHLRNAMKGLTDSLMIVSEPFAVAYGMDALLHALIIDIGAGTTDFCVMSGRYPTEDDQRTLAQAGDWVDEQLAKMIGERYPDARFSIHMVREWKEKHELRRRAQGAGRGDRAGQRQAHPARHHRRDARRLRRAAARRWRRPCSTCWSRVEPEYQERVRHNVILSGGSGLIGGLGAALEKALGEVGGGKVRVVEGPGLRGLRRRPGHRPRRARIGLGEAGCRERLLT